MILQDNIKEKIKRHALKDLTQECCGLLVEKDNSIDVFECSNVSESPKNHFSILPRDYLRASRSGSIKAVYHSHNSDNNKFSPNDILHSRSHKIAFILYCSTKDSFSAFDPDRDKTFLYDKIFKIGESDCYTVVKEYYKNLGIDLADSPNSRKDHTWHQKNPSLIQDLFNLNKSNPELPIIEINPTEDLKKHDVIVFEYIKNRGPNHVAIYLGEGKILHHPRNKYLCIEPLSKPYQKTICKIYRHEQLN